MKGSENNLNGDILVSIYSHMISKHCFWFTREGIFSVIIAYKKLREWQMLYLPKYNGRPVSLQIFSEKLTA